MMICGVGGVGIASEESDLERTLEGEGRGLDSHEIHEMELKSSEEKCDPMDTREVEKGDEIDSFSSGNGNDLGEDSSWMPVNRRFLEVQDNIFPRREKGRKRSLVEVFSVTFLEKEEAPDISPILEDNLVLISCYGDNKYEYILYDISCSNHIEINSEDQLILQGPDRGIEVGDAFAMGPFHHPYPTVPLMILWLDIYESDHFMADFLETKNGFMTVKFAVYSDALEAKLDISIFDLNLLQGPQTRKPLKVYGTVRTSNSAITHSQAKSVLFDHRKCSNSFVLTTSTGEAEIPLPLSRRVTVIPRESDLTVDVSLFANCTSQDISIANSSVVFHAATRCSATVEDKIIIGSLGKVRIKVTWMEAMEDGASAKEEEEEVEDKEDEIEQEASQEIYGGEEDDEDAETDYISDDDRSFRSVKLRCLKSQEDVSTSASAYLMTDTNEIDDMGQGARKGSNSHQRFKRPVLEVFSVKVVSSESLSLDGVYGYIMIYTGLPVNLLFRRVRGDPPKINSEGFAILEGPRGFAWRIFEDVFILPVLFRYQEFEFKDEKVSCEWLWRDDEYDELLHKRLVIDVGSIEVNFAVYEDGIEALLDMMLINCSFSSSEVYGTITASNSMLQDPGAKSVVFKKEKFGDLDATVGSEEDLDIRVRSTKEIALPLSRPIVSLPFGSTLKLDFDIYSRGGPIDCLTVEFPIELTGVSEKNLPGNGCSVRVKVSFFEEQRTLPLDHGGSYF